LTKEAVGLAFSKAAATYDEACDFQKEAGQRLIDRILSDGLEPGKILDIGMGTGGIAHELSLRFKRPVHGCDLAWGMVLFSKTNRAGIMAVQADMENLPYKRGAFDVIFSNIAHQWCRDSKAAFLEVKRVLQAGGRFYFSILAEGSLGELYKSIENVTGHDYSRELFLSSAAIESKLISAGFEFGYFETRILRRYYRNSFELVKRLKDMGAGKIPGVSIFGMGQRNRFLRMLEFYNRHFCESGKAFASYNVVSGCVRKI
jgi:malonyl-CoA O-methyltransferase